jgi:bifunctional DNase/RNase
MDAAQQHVILLKPIDPLEMPGRVLPVWIGAQEATSILVAVQGVTPPRPLAHDLMTRLLDALDGAVDRVEVTRIDDGTFYAEVTVTTPRGTRVIDARPSDAIALAARTDAPVWVADAVLLEAGIDDLDDDDPEDEEKVDEFRRFLDDIAPEDFQG